MVKPFPALSCVVKDTRRGCFTARSVSSLHKTITWGLLQVDSRTTSVSYVSAFNGTLRKSDGPGPVLHVLSILTITPVLDYFRGYYLA